jgi:hypothetical protein
MVDGRYNGHRMRNIFSIILKGVGIFVGMVLLVLGGFMGLENFQAPRAINIPIAIFSLAAIFAGSIMLWLSLRKNPNI